MQQLVTITFFRYSGWRQRWWAFTQMGLSKSYFDDIPGLQFVKLLGSGGGNGFSIRPDFGTYALLAVWENEAYTQQFLQHPVFETFKRHSVEQWTVFMKTTKVHGQWDGVAPFTETVDYDKKKLVAVLTRATIQPRQLWRFWRFVPPVSASVEGRAGLIFSKGIGELPLIQQATFSLWEDSEKMLAYAYQSHYHKEVVQKTRELGWYKEELFSRFHPYAAEGSWKAGNPLADYL